MKNAIVLPGSIEYQLRCEIAAILASGFVEMRRVQLRLEKPSGIVSESRVAPLDDTGKTVLPVHGG